MRLLRQFGALVLLLVMGAAPAMACMVPDAQMSAQERACCQMKDQCEQAGMSASHGCCQKTPQSIYVNALDTKTVTFHPVVVLAIWRAAAELLNPTTVASEWIDRPEYSPPKSPPATISILRI